MCIHVARHEEEDIGDEEVLAEEQRDRERFVECLVVELMLDLPVGEAEVLGALPSGTHGATLPEPSC
jgi:hypothetical protein